ncbi:hypothetical protein Vau01_106070 [Virgisporangium aurantiacum]|uniref:Uncharacterized protein n=1 Tax=Virgisporangium aurantiacum TaxID=175570 RepID=A0A8J3ZFT7_9ACTN|nr:hypothetical protein Vau01_106070 [Virgisporangium aurantiacum]
MTVGDHSGRSAVARLCPQRGLGGNIELQQPSTDDAAEPAGAPTAVLNAWRLARISEDVDHAFGDPLVKHPGWTGSRRKDVTTDDDQTGDVSAGLRSHGGWIPRYDLAAAKRCTFRIAQQGKVDLHPGGIRWRLAGRLVSA